MRTNDERVDRALFALTEGGYRDGQDNEEAVTDLLTDLRHAFTGETFNRALTQSQHHYESERDVEENSDPIITYPFDKERTA